MVGLMNTSVTTLLLFFSLLLKSHFNTGIRDKSGMPEPVSEFSVLSSPPNTIMSSFLALIIALYMLLDFCGGALCGG
jgi:hypothetical protein